MRLRDIAITPSVNRRLSPAARPIVGDRPPTNVYKVHQTKSRGDPKLSKQLMKIPFVLPALLHVLNELASLLCI